MIPNRILRVRSEHTWQHTICGGRTNSNEFLKLKLTKPLKQYKKSYVQQNVEPASLTGISTFAYYKTFN